MHTVVRLAGFFTEHGNIELLSIGFIEKILNKAVLTMPLPMIASLTLLIFASISFLLLPTLTIQQGHLLMQIKYAFTYPLVGISMICQDFYK